MPSTFPYPAEVESSMRVLYRCLRENDRRCYAAVEAAKLGHGGTDYIASLLGCDPKTIRQGQHDLDELRQRPPEQLAPRPRVRKEGGGRKKKVEELPELVPAFHEVLEGHTAGSPVKPVLWTDLSVVDIREALMEKDLYVGEQVVRDLLWEAGYRLRKAQKYLDMGQHKDRDAQFHNLARIKEEYLASGEPILSIDTKKKEWLGTFYRAGRLYTLHGPVAAYDHDYQRFATGVVVPYGLYDLKRNSGYVNIGTSKDTSAFATDSIEWWWRGWGQWLYRGARSLCLFADGGGSNHVDHYLFKEDLQGLSNRLGLEVRVAHYPPYCSKYNPIERRLFCHLTRAAQGVLFDAAETVKRLFERARTATGLSVVAAISTKIYQLGRKCAEGFKQGMKIVFDDFLPRWNYRAIPQAST